MNTRTLKRPEIGFNAYQSIASTTALPVTAISAELTYNVLGLANEAGELAGKIKKIMRDKRGVISDKDREELRAELGDVIWYASQTANELGITLQDVAESNIKKIKSRQERGQTMGSGDDR